MMVAMLNRTPGIVGKDNVEIQKTLFVRLKWPKRYNNGVASNPSANVSEFAINSEHHSESRQ